MLPSSRDLAHKMQTAGEISGLEGVVSLGAQNAGTLPLAGPEGPLRPFQGVITAVSSDSRVWVRTGWVVEMKRAQAASGPVRKCPRLPLRVVGEVNQSETHGDDFSKEGVSRGMQLLLRATPPLPLLPEHLEARCAEAWGVAPPAVPFTIALARAHTQAPVAAHMVQLQGRLDAALAEAIRSAAPPTADVDPQVPQSPLVRMQRAWEDAHAAGGKGSVGEGVSERLVLQALHELQQAPSPSEPGAYVGMAAPAAGSEVEGMDASRARATLRAHCEARLVLKPDALRLLLQRRTSDAQESRGHEGGEGGGGEAGEAEGSGAPAARPADAERETASADAPRLRQLRSLVLQVELRLEIASTPTEIVGATEPLSGGEYRELKKLLTMYANLASPLSDDSHGLVRYVSSLARRYGARLPLTVGRLRADFDIHEAGGEAGSGEAGGGDRGAEAVAHVYAHDADGAGRAAPMASLLRPAPRRESSGGSTAGGGGVPLSSLPGFGVPGGLVRAASSLSACPPPAPLLRRQTSCVSLDRQSSVGAGAARAPFRLVTVPREPRAKRATAAKPAGDQNRKAGSKAATKQAAPPVGVGSKRAARKAALCSPAATRGEVFVSETPTRPTTRVGSDSGSNPGSARRATRSAVLVLESPQLPSRTCASRVG
jgi:hypothetical protein